MEFVPPIVRGEFVYRDVLLVDVGGELKRHSRATEHEIKALLSGKSKDQVGHWWESQLIHYGLQRSKVKDTAKVRLQQALTQGKLKSQPPHLADMENQMKKEYQSAVRKAMKSKTDTGKGTKRSREDETESSSKKTKISVRVGDVEIDIDHSNAGVTKKQKTTKTTAAKITETKKPTKTSSKSTATPKKTAQTPKGNKLQGDAVPFSTENVFQRSASTPKAQPKPKASASIKPESKVKREPGAANSSPARAVSSPVKREGYLFDADAMDTRADLTQDKLYVTGVYTINCPQITEQLEEHDDKLRLFMCVDNETGTTWGGFQLAMKSGVIRMDEIDFNRKLSFSWRAKDSWLNDLKFGQKCFGEIEFDGAGGVRGMFFNMFNEPCEFDGYRRTGPQWSGRSAYSYKQEWEAFPKQAYGR